MVPNKAFTLCLAVLAGALSFTVASAAEKSHRTRPASDATLAPDRADVAPFGYPAPFGDIGYNGYFGEPVLYGAYHGDGSCYFARHRAWTPYGWRFRLVQICG